MIWVNTSIVDYVEWDLGVETYFLHNGIKKYLLYEIKVLCHYDDHFHIPLFHKTLYGQFYLFIGEGVETVVVWMGLFHKIQ